MRSRYTCGLVLGALLVAVAACSGGPGGGGDPASVVSGAMGAVASKDMTALQGFACEAQKDEIADQFDFSSALGNLGGEVDQQAFLDAVTIDTSKVTVGQAAVNGSTATVPLSGSMSIDIDTEKIKPLIKQILESQGLPADDATVAQAISMMGAFSGQEIPMNESLELVQEGGAWKICE